MTTYSRRKFLRHLSMASLAGTASVGSAIALTPEAEAQVDAFFAGFAGEWDFFGPPAQWHAGSEGLTAKSADAFAIARERLTDAAFTFRARTPESVEQVQIWAGIRCRDRESRYVFALRGGNNDDLYFARYAPDGGSKFLGIAPLDFHPVPGTWYTLRAVVKGNRFQIFVGDEKLPRINVVDTDALWTDGGVCLGGSWLPTEYPSRSDAHALTPDEAAAFDAIGAATWQPPTIDRAAKRQAQRAAYKGITVAKFEGVRSEIPLDGDWLFLPEQELPAADAAPQTAGFDDANWHVMDVPNFWTPTLSWLHGETAFNYLSGVSIGKGISDKLFGAELKRLDSYTFPWRDTHSAWYRQHLDLPADLTDRRFLLCFDAIAKVSQVWVNGVKVGTHIGMFGEVVCDATGAMKPGRNVIAVHVAARADNHRATGNQVVGVAVTVEVTAAMLNSLPHGMYPDNAAGIWQPVRLIVTRPTAIDDVYIKPHLDGFDAEITIQSATARSVNVGYTIRSKRDGSVLHTELGKSESVTAGATILHLATPTLAPLHWTPWEPNLYDLELTVTANNTVIDRKAVSFGFRTFAVADGKLSLNGKPFRLRGGNHFPNALRPNDARLARRFMQLARDGNVSATRSHTAPFTRTWLDAADEVGMAVSFEGTWPWLMLTGDPPADDLVKAWHDEFAALMRTHRNHPSLVMWTVNNEMKFETQDRATPDRLLKKWTILDAMVKTMRATDPTRPISCDSSYYRAGLGKNYDDFVKPHGFDDGDIDDAHRYYGWYEQSFFHLFADGTFGKNLHTPGRPLISQEMATGYPRNDDGHPTRFYLFQHHTPQSLVGDEAWENRAPAFFLSRQAFMTKELAEVFRRADRNDCAGILHFAYVSWFRNVWDADTIAPFPAYHGLKKALQPVLVSAELFGRHFYAGTHRRIRVCLANDANDGAALPATRLVWELQVAGKPIATGAIAAPPVAYYANAWLDLDLAFPEHLPAPRVDAALVLRLEHNGKTLSTNDYDITVATPGWAMAGITRWPDLIPLFDPNSRAPKSLSRPPLHPVTTLDNLRPTQGLVVADAEQTLRLPGVADRLRQFATDGGKILLLNPGTELPKLFPDRITGYRNCEGEIATMRVPESPIFDGIAPLDLAWFEMGPGNLPRACRGTWHIANAPGTTALAHVVDRHGYLKKTTDVVAISGSPLIHLTVGNGHIYASELTLEASGDDPIAGRLLDNLLRALVL